MFIETNRKLLTRQTKTGVVIKFMRSKRDSKLTINRWNMKRIISFPFGYESKIVVIAKIVKMRTHSNKDSPNR